MARIIKLKLISRDRHICFFVNDVSALVLNNYKPC